MEDGQNFRLSVERLERLVEEARRERREIEKELAFERRDREQEIATLREEVRRQNLEIDRLNQELQSKNGRSPVANRILNGLYPTWLPPLNAQTLWTIVLLAVLLNAIGVDVTALLQSLIGKIQ
jgi:hypothetical protein